MQSSFRISKVFLNKAASFGLGLAAGDRYVNSQSGQHLELFEEASLRHMHMRPLVGTELHELGVELGLSVPSVPSGHDGDIDVDSSSLFGYSRSCFSSAALSSAATQLSPLVETKRPSVPLGTADVPSSAPPNTSTCPRAATEPHEELETQHRDQGSQLRSRIATPVAPRLLGAKAQPVQLLEVENRHVSIDVATAPKRVGKEEEAPLLKQHEQMEPEKQKEQVEPEREEVAAGAAAVLWSSLVKADQCTICADLLAVPVSTACDHSFCGVCFLDMQRAHRDVFPLDCPNCRAPLRQGEQPRDQRRDGRIAQQVDRFVQQQEWLEQQGVCVGGAGGCGLQRDESWREHYAEWLSRREQFHLATAAPLQLELEQSQPRSMAEELQLELDDEEWDDEAWAGGAGVNPTAASAAVGDVFVALGLAVALCGVVLLSRQPTSQRPVLRDVAAALFSRR